MKPETKPETDRPLFYVAGATGYTGQAVVRAARARGLHTTAHVRPDSASLPRWRETFGAMGATVDSTPWALDALTATMARLCPTVVFGLLGTTRKRGASDGGTYATVDYGLTAMLIDAALAAGVRPKFVYLSALGVAPGRSPEGYLGVRYRLEQKLVAADLPFVIARPAIITGPDRGEDRPGERIGAVVGDALLGAVSRLGGRGLASKYASTTAEILGGALVRLAVDRNATALFAEGEALR